MKAIKFLAVATMAGALAGCASYVQTTKTIYYAPEHSSRGTIAVVAFDRNLNESLSFVPKKRNIESHLSSVGYTIVNADESPTYLALVSYGIDNGTTTVSSVPIFGQTGGGTTYHSGTVSSFGSSGSYSGSSYTMPTYGIVGSQTVSSRLYTRHVDIDILLASSLSAEKPKKMYEMRGKSSGSCSVIEGIFDEITSALFDKFPGVNGKSETLVVDWDGKC